MKKNMKKINSNKLNILNLALIVGLVGAIMGFFVSISGNLFKGYTGVGGCGFGFGGSMMGYYGTSSILYMPLMYGVFGFIAGLLFGLLYNALSDKIIEWDDTTTISKKRCF